MSRRAYGQNCGLARALDVLGERWTLLLLRELGMGPLRYKDLSARLPVMGTNLLAERLRSLEQAGVIERTALAPPASTTAYVLTEAGEELRPVLGRLAAWGLHHGAPFDDRDESRPSWSILAFFSGSGTSAVSEIGGVVQVVVDDETAWGDPCGGDVRLHGGLSPVEPRLILTTDLATMGRLLEGRVSLREAVSSGAVDLHGADDAVHRFPSLYDAAASSG